MTLAALHQRGDEFRASEEPLFTKVERGSGPGAGRAYVHDCEGNVGRGPKDSLEPLAVRPYVCRVPGAKLFGVPENAVGGGLWFSGQLVGRALRGLPDFAGRRTASQQQDQQQSHRSSPSIRDVVSTFRKQPFSREVAAALDSRASFASAILNHADIFFRDQCQVVTRKLVSGASA